MRTDKLTTDKHTDTHRYTLIILLLRSPTQNEIKISEIATENRLAKKIWPFLAKNSRNVWQSVTDQQQYLIVRL